MHKARAKRNYPPRGPILHKIKDFGKRRRSTNVKAKPERSAPKRTIDEATETFKVSKAKFKISEPLVISRELNYVEH